MRATAYRKLIEIPRPIRVDKLTEVMRIRGVPVYVHWSVWLIVLLILFNVIRHPLKSGLALAAYFGVLLIHESGHLVAAQKMHCDVISIRLYPILGVTQFQTPWSRLDHCIITWAGVLAQAAVAVPIIVFVSVFGYSRFEPLNALLAILGFFSVGVAIFNLLPIRPLDGSIAWGIIPEAFRSVWNRNNNGTVSRKH